MLSPEKIVTILKDRNLREVSRRTGLSYMTVWRISHGCAGNIEYNTVQKLSEYLEKKCGE
jgi:DNA-binding Xre family transcriptional regulator